MICRALFTTSLHGEEKRDITLSGISSEMMQLLINYSYLRKLEITEKNVYELLLTADYLSILGVLELCCTFLTTRLSPTNCIGVMFFARCEALK